LLGIQLTLTIQAHMKKSFLTAGLLLMSFWSHAEGRPQDAELFQAVSKCDVSKVDLLLNAGANSNARQDNLPDGLPVLVYTILQSCSDPKSTNSMITLLMKKGADVEAIYSDGYTKFPISHLPFYLDGQTETLISFFETMVKNGANPNAIDSKGNNISRAIMNRITSQDVLKLMKMGFSYSGRQSAFFPPYFGTDKSKAELIEVVKATDFDYKKGHYELDAANAIYREFRHFGVYSGEPLAEIKKSMSFYKETLLPFMKDLWEIPSGPEGRLPLVNLMLTSCPAVQLTDRLSLDHGKPDEGQDEKLFMQQIPAAYELLLQIIKDGDFDYKAVDKNGIQTLTYALNLCPNEVVQEIQKKTSLQVDNRQQELILEEFNKKIMHKSYLELALFNNDHRNFETLKSFGVNVDSISLDKFNVKNKKILSSLPKRKMSWKKIEDFGFDRDLGVKVRAQAKYIFKQFTDLKRTTFDMRSLNGNGSFQYTGIPVSMELFSRSNPGTRRSVTIFDQTKAVNFNHSGANLSFGTVGGYEHTGNVILSELDANNDVILAFIETRTDTTKSFQRNSQEMITVSRNQPYFLTGKYNSLLDDKSYRYVSADSQLTCSVPVCDYLKFDKNGPDFEVRIDEDKLKREDLGAYTLWVYLNTQPEKRKEFILSLGKTPDPAFIAYAADLLRTNFENQRQEAESLAILDTILGLEFSQKLPFEIDVIKSKFQEMNFITASSKNYQSIRKFILTGKDINEAFTKLTVSSSQIEEFILLGKSYELKGQYLENYRSLSKLMVQDLARLTSRLGLTSEQVEVIRKI
jgi:hypothetical protein